MGLVRDGLVYERSAVWSSALGLGKIEGIMFLSRLDLQGFKTFAQKTSLQFLPPLPDRLPITVIVGPNGSGKSNLSDAIRWSLGEQSLKLLRGKQSDDVIFGGSDGRHRAGMAEVVLTFDNRSGSFPLNFAEVAIARRIFRDGTSTYLVNGEETRANEIALMLAEAGVGQRTYAVIGQGAIDSVIVASAASRKRFFDDATGVQPLIIKRHQARLKLKRSLEHLTEARLVLAELEPRLAMLRRQAKRLLEREQVAAGFKLAAEKFYGKSFSEAKIELKKAEEELGKIEKEINLKREEGALVDAKLAQLEEASRQNKADEQLIIKAGREQLKLAQDAFFGARRKLAELEREIELSKVRTQLAWAPLPLSAIISGLNEITDKYLELIETLRNLKDLSKVESVLGAAEDIQTQLTQLRGALIKPNPEAWTMPEELAKKQVELKALILRSEEDLRAQEKKQETEMTKQSSPAEETFALARAARALQAEMIILEQRRSVYFSAQTRAQTRIEALAGEIESLELETQIKLVLGQEFSADVRVEELHGEMLRLRRQLEQIGGLDETILKEAEEAEKRFGILNQEVVDLGAAIESTQKIIEELSNKINDTGKRAFSKLNSEFQKYFKVLFGGGNCRLVQIEGDDRRDGQLTVQEVSDEEGDDDEPIFDGGVEIEVAPPGKIAKGLQLLSGGERALTAIALLCAVMATNPSPFVVLDEVDAALDETNTVRFANILQELAHKTQFIVITHNRATMEKADALYGVSLNDDGTSRLLSVKLADLGEATARR